MSGSGEGRPIPRKLKHMQGNLSSWGVRMAPRQSRRAPETGGTYDTFSVHESYPIQRPGSAAPTYGGEYNTVAINTYQPPSQYGQPPAAPAAYREFTYAPSHTIGASPTAPTMPSPDYSVPLNQSGLRTRNMPPGYEGSSRSERPHYSRHHTPSSDYSDDSNRVAYTGMPGYSPAASPAHPYSVPYGQDSSRHGYASAHRRAASVQGHRESMPMPSPVVAASSHRSSRSSIAHASTPTQRSRPGAPMPAPTPMHPLQMSTVPVQHGTWVSENPAEWSGSQQGSHAYAPQDYNYPQVPAGPSAGMVAASYQQTSRRSVQGNSGYAADADGSSSDSEGSGLSGTASSSAWRPEGHSNQPQPTSGRSWSSLHGAV